MTTEAAFQAQVIELATLCGWESMHVRRTRGRTRRGVKWLTATSVDGWPDVVLWRPGEFLMVELKTDKGRLTAEQAAVHRSLRAAGVDVRVWRPRHWESEVQPLLSARQREAS